MGYGSRGAGGVIPGDATLVFEVGASFPLRSFAPPEHCSALLPLELARSGQLTPLFAAQVELLEIKNRKAGKEEL